MVFIVQLLLKFLNYRIHEVLAEITKGSGVLSDIYIPDFLNYTNKNIW